MTPAEVRAVVEAAVRAALQRDDLCGSRVPTFAVSLARVDGNILDDAREQWTTARRHYADAGALRAAPGLRDLSRAVVEKAGHILINKGARQAGFVQAASPFEAQEAQGPARAVLLSPWRTADPDFRAADGVQVFVSEAVPYIEALRLHPSPAGTFQLSLALDVRQAGPSFVVTVAVTVGRRGPAAPEFTRVILT